MACHAAGALRLLVAALVLSRSAPAAFERAGRPADSPLAGNPAGLAALPGPALRLDWERPFGLEELTAHGLSLGTTAGRLRLGAGLQVRGPDRSRELEGRLVLAVPLAAVSLGAGAELLELDAAGAPPVRRWTPSFGLAVRPGSWEVAGWHRSAAGGLTGPLSAASAARRTGSGTVAASLTRRGPRSLRLRLWVALPLSATWQVTAGTRSKPRQLELAVAWSRDGLRLDHRLETHPDLDLSAGLAVEGARAGGARRLPARPHTAFLLTGLPPPPQR